MKNKYLIAIFFVIFLDLLGFSLILPLLPAIAEKFRTTQVVVGLLASVYAIAQLIADPLFGRLSDRMGRRPVLLISIVGNFASFIISGFAGSLWIFFAARILSGGTGGTISTAQAYISDVTDKNNRAKSFGLIGAAFGLGFIMGPALGGFLSRFGFAIPIFLAAGLALINLVLVFFWLPESLTAERRKLISKNTKPPFTLKALIDTLHLPMIGPLLNTRFLFALAFTMITTIFPSYAFIKFGLDSQSTGYLLAYVGVLSVIVQGFLIGKLSARFSDKLLIFAGTLLLGVSVIGWALAQSVVMIVIVFIPTALAGGVFNTIINTAITKSVKPTEVGGTLGISSSLESMTRVVAPSLGAVFLEKIGAYAPGVFCALILSWLTIYVWRTILHPKIIL
jgi:DHA1 family tetracycline resistance protein-like MFS transporter